MQAAWTGVGRRMAMAPRESTSHRSMPSAGKSGGGGGGGGGRAAAGGEGADEGAASAGVGNGGGAAMSCCGCWRAVKVQK